jgi:hypothetical protein
VDTLAADVTPGDLTYPKLASDAAIRAAQNSPLGRVYLDWSPMPILTEELAAPGSAVKTQAMRKMIFRDPRFMGDVTGLRTSGSTPLMGVVTVDDSDKIVRQTLGGRREPQGHGPVREVDWDPALAALWLKATSPTAKPAAQKPPHSEVAAVKPVGTKPVVVPSAPIAASPAPMSTSTTTTTNIPLAKTEPVTTEAPKAPAPKPKPPVAEVVKPAPVVPAPVVAPTPAPTPAVVKAVPPPSAVVSKPVLVTPKKTEVVKAVPANTGPGIVERGETKVSAQYQRFRNWIRWLTNTK